MTLFQNLALCRVSISRNAVCTRCAHRNYSQTTLRPGHPFDILFFGRDEFSCLVLNELHKAQDVWNELALVTQPDTKTGRRGSVLSISPLKQLGESLSLPVHEIPPDRPSFRTWEPPARYATHPPPPSRLLISASFGRILSNKLLGYFAPGRRLNVHPSLLPAYRGASPIQYTIIDGQKEAGVCVIEMMERKKGIDAGDIWGMSKMPTIPGKVSFEGLRDELGVQGGRLLVSVLRDMLEGKATSAPQVVDPLAPRAPLVTEEDALVNFAGMSAEQVVRRYLGISHQKALYAIARNGKRVQLHGLSVYEGDIAPLLSHIPEVGLATLDSTTKTVVTHCASTTFLCAKMLKNEGKNLIPAKEWWNGVRPDMRIEGGEGPVQFLPKGPSA